MTAAKNVTVTRHFPVFNFTLSVSFALKRLVLPVFTARCYASAVVAMALCLSVCLSVRPSQVAEFY